MRATDLVSIQIKVLFEEQEAKILCLAQNIKIMQGEKVNKTMNLVQRWFE